MSSTHERPLAGKTIIDFSHRLPGPLAGKLLAGLGADVIKIEDAKFKDPFIYGLFAEMDNSFPKWYEELNANKTILRLDFNNEAAQEQIRETIFKADAIIMGIPKKIQQKLGITIEDIQKNVKQSFAAVIPLASKEAMSHMHDLNALAMTGLLSLHLRNINSVEDVAPPFLPLAGINFGQKMAFDLLGAMYKSKESNKVETINSYLYESTQEVFDAFWPKDIRDTDHKFLHNGLYPCYNIYQTKDSHFVVMACVEEKFWQSFREAFSFEASDEDRFKTDGSIHKRLKDLFGEMTSQQVKEKLGSLDICINLIK
ncbi:MULTISPECIES: CoA transferase [Halobacteriovorax]|uniref:CoA transferase n=1 Tax=Halobacteriovorax vibrionivorans TaxID=2152716 RepID=A0ABY0IH81_9BACT|nr:MULTISPECIES: CoA transferase [Halobacteriovorax]AYF44277.1 CoA-transferase family III protein [Halobacteriovorax sp. BALOs_7]RZF21196.1 CoA transferase [Halobacteriovorax vibrionivorans]TGD45666.1 CoA transferase [Halobacteriovorax sp. Y22]